MLVKVRSSLNAPTAAVCRRWTTTWIEQRRSQVEFAPNDQSQVDAFLQNEASDAPLQQALRLARKVREQKRRLLEKTAHVVEDDEA